MNAPLEYLSRNQPGMYAVVLVIPAAKDLAWIVCNLGDYFEKRLQHATPSAELDCIASKSPEVVHVMTCDDPIAQVSLQFEGRNGFTARHGIETHCTFSECLRPLGQ